MWCQNALVNYQKYNFFFFQIFFTNTKTVTIFISICQSSSFLHRNVLLNNAWSRLRDKLQARKSVKKMYTTGFILLFWCWFERNVSILDTKVDASTVKTQVRRSQVSDSKYSVQALSLLAEVTSKPCHSLLLWNGQIQSL